MGLRINTNELALSAQRNLGTTQRHLSKTMQRLSSGSRIVEAGDDPAGLAISDGLNAQIRSLGAAIRNAQDGISMVQVFEGGTNEINNMMVRIRELAMQAASDTIGDAERGMINNEVEELTLEISRVANTTNFAGRYLLNGEIQDLDIQVGPNNDPDKDRIKFAPGETDLRSDALGIEGLNVSSKDGAQSTLDDIDQAMTRVNQVRAKVGSFQSRLNTTVQAQGIFKENLMAAYSRIRDADVAEEATNLAKQSILRQAGVSVLTQANEMPAVALQLLK
jgi:flagellin